ncbi:metallophosphoesterase family protein [Bartonella florencae]|uniref:metallophosphoesterase family protein n=1 Tax=Bartonella florencae TaxID=928210 RepID=UPI0003081924|nr:metallophosphoesterase [Bartonella florencae]
MKYKYKTTSIIFSAILSYTNCANGGEIIPNTAHDGTKSKNQFVNLTHQPTARIASVNNTKISSNSSKKISKKNYTAIIMSDPQAWCLDYGNPHGEKNKILWLKKNKKVAQAIKSQKADFYIINGDLTEYGRRETYEGYTNIYKKLDAPVYEGLGNHDYANNVGNCTLPEEQNSSGDACAIDSLSRMIKEIKKYSEELPHFNQDIKELSDASYKSVHSIEGSFSYSWDYGDVHYVQLHNYPTYTVNLKQSDKVIQVKSSLDWLKKDLAAADARGKITIINFHDAMAFFPKSSSHFINPQNIENLLAFKSIITSHNVKAIFAGHTHYQTVCRAQDDKVFGNIPVYTSGALFRGDYYLIEVEGKNIHVKAYNGRTGKPTLIEDLGEIDTYTELFESCSNL